MLASAVRQLVYRKFLETGNTPGAAALAHELDATAEAVKASLKSLEAEHALVLAPATSCTVWMAHPFSNVPTDYRVLANDRSWWANCAWDALGVVALLHRDADIRSRCACCAEPIILKARDGLVRGKALLHFVVPPRQFWENVGYT
jgi:Alkylmercury lyase